MRRGRGVLRRRWLRRTLYPVTMVVVAAAFLANAVLSVVGPIRQSRDLVRTLGRLRGHYIAEDVFRRALLLPDLKTGATLSVVEGDLSPWPERPVLVQMRRQPAPPQVVCAVERGGGYQTFQADYSCGVLPEAFGWALGQGDPAAEEADDLLVRGRQGRLSHDPANDNVFPFSVPGAWEVAADLDVRASRLLDDDGDDPHLGNFELTPHLPLAHLSAPTDLDDIALGREQSSRLVAAFRSREGLVVRVRGHLWLGRCRQPLLVGTGGRTVVLLVEGNVYVGGGVRLLGPNDALVIVAGRADWPAFRDLDGDGRREAGEPGLRREGVQPRGALVPREGAGLVYLGLGGVRPFVHATLVASHDVIVGPAGAVVLGTVLAGDRLLRLGTRPGPLEIYADTRQRDADLPRRGLPVRPGTEMCERITGVRLMAGEGRERLPGLKRGIGASPLR